MMRPWRCRPDARLPAFDCWPPRPGLTLLELMIVTIIFGILATLAAGPVLKARERTMVAAVRQEVSTTLRALAMYQLEHGVLPTTLAAAGVAPGRGVRVCRYEVLGDSAVVAFRHEGSSTRVDGLYRDGGSRIEEGPGAECGSSEEGDAQAGQGAGSGNGNGRGNGNGNGGGGGNGNGRGGGVGGGRNNNR